VVWREALAKCRKAFYIVYYVYIIQSLKDASYYIGVTANLKRRISEHNNGGAKYSKSKCPIGLYGFPVLEIRLKL